MICEISADLMSFPRNAGMNKNKMNRNGGCTAKEYGQSRFFSGLCSVIALPQIQIFESCLMEFDTGLTLDPDRNQYQIEKLEIKLVDIYHQCLT